MFNEKGETKWETVTEAGQETTKEEEVTSTFLGTKNFVSDGGDWFAKTTEADRAQRVGGDPLAPLKSGGMTRKEKEDRMVGIERDSTNWYKNQETKRSMFGRTLNPLTGSLQDIKDTDNVETLNPLEVLFAVKHAKKVVNPFVVEVDQLERDPYRVALFELALVRHAVLECEHRARLAVQVVLAEPDRFQEPIGRAVECHVVVRHVHVAVVVDPVR